MVERFAAMLPALAFAAAALLLLPTLMMYRGLPMRRIRWFAVAGLIALGACTEPAYYEKRQLGRRILQLDDNELETGFQNKVNASREVSGGRPGHSAGGGCGCGN